MSQKQRAAMTSTESINVIMAFMKQQQEEKVTRYQMLNQFAKKDQILFVGSSLMEQFPINEMQQTLEKPFIIYNRSVGGFVSADLIENLDTCIFELEPSQIFINIGSNDIGSPTYQLNHLIENYEKILSQIKQRLPKAKVYVMAYYPVNTEATFPNVGQEQKNFMFQNRTNTALKVANQAVEKLAEKHNYTFINVNEGLIDETGNLKAEFSVEGIHMWPNAYEVVLQNIKKYL
jgi:lysophospholipase L1-like esterase